MICCLLSKENAIDHKISSSSSTTYIHSKIVELEEELRVVGNNLKSLEVSEEKVICLYLVLASTDDWNSRSTKNNRKNICQFVFILIAITKKKHEQISNWLLKIRNRPTNAKRNTRTKSKPSPLVSRRFVLLSVCVFFSMFLIRVEFSFKPQ